MKGRMRIPHRKCGCKWWAEKARGPPCPLPARRSPMCHGIEEAGNGALSPRKRALLGRCGGVTEAGLSAEKFHLFEVEPDGRFWCRIKCGGQAPLCADHTVPQCGPGQRVARLAQQGSYFGCWGQFGGHEYEKSPPLSAFCRDGGGDISRNSVISIPLLVRRGKAFLPGHQERHLARGLPPSLFAAATQAV